MSLEELYREVILDHYRNPRRRDALAAPTAHAEGHNPLCGDEITIDVAVSDGKLSEIAVSGQGCSISQASASMMAEAVTGKTLEEVDTLTGQFKSMMGIGDGADPIDPERPGATLGDLESLQGVKKFPVRIKCADLGWTTLEEALSSD
ncbi:MAG: SUF system NifU family Fe-S cluster assembly protein [Acidimicrobiia bacterium]|nr:SUF system NifU family Fe-S cluster assembly protein [Acidimicrobiia bacterium]